MRVILVRTLKLFWVEHPDSEQALRAWFDEARAASWDTPNDIKTQYRSASILKDGRVVFNIAGNKYRLIVAVAYKTHVLLIKFIGDHQTYDAVDAQTVALNRSGERS